MPIREFDTGATRDSEEGKYDYEGFLSPLVLQRYATYMHGHRKQSDGALRDSDNWQKGIPISAYMKSMWRHLIEVWTLYRAHFSGPIDQDAQEEALCAILFNVSGFLHELRKQRGEMEGLFDLAEKYADMAHPMVDHRKRTSAPATDAASPDSGPHGMATD